MSMPGGGGCKASAVNVNGPVQRACRKLTGTYCLPVCTTPCHQQVNHRVTHSELRILPLKCHCRHCMCVLDNPIGLQAQHDITMVLSKTDMACYTATCRSFGAVQLRLAHHEWASLHRDSCRRPRRDTPVRQTLLGECHNLQPAQNMLCLHVDARSPVCQTLTAHGGLKVVLV